MTVWNWRVTFTMRNSYIKISLNDKNEFRTRADFRLFGVNYEKIDVKIDTGCPQTTILTQKLGIPAEQSAILKQLDIDDPSIKKSPTFGVNDSKEFKDKVKNQFRNGIYVGTSAISFTHFVDRLKICGVYVNIEKVKVNYDRIGNILIGMDIMKHWDIHMGKVSTGETIFLACPQEQLNEEYFAELDRLFDIRNNINIAKKNTN